MTKHDAINYFGSATELARALGITKASISQWGVYVPPLRAFQIERMTDGKLKANHEQRAA